MRTVHLRVLIRFRHSDALWTSARYYLSELMRCGMVGGQTLILDRRGRVLPPRSLRSHRNEWAVRQARKGFRHKLETGQWAALFHAVEGIFDRDRIGEVEDLPWVKGLSVVRVSDREPLE